MARASAQRRRERGHTMPRVSGRRRVRTRSQHGARCRARHARDAVPARRALPGDDASGRGHCAARVAGHGTPGTQSHHGALPGTARPERGHTMARATPAGHAGAGASGTRSHHVAHPVGAEDRSARHDAGSTFDSAAGRAIRPAGDNLYQ